jgi:diguanylate cyclase (GGDEF)-like protein
VPYGIYEADPSEHQQCTNHSLGHYSGFLRLEQDIDELTQLANHYYFLKFINQEWQRLSREKNYLSLILCEISFDREFEELYGEVTKYRCLQKIASAIRGAAKRPADLVARYLFQRFAVLLPNTPLLGASQVAKEIQFRIKNLSLEDIGLLVDITPEFYQDLQLNLGLAGIIPSTTSTPENLIHQAEQALSQAQTKGVEQVVFEHHLTESVLV